MPYAFNTDPAERPHQVSIAWALTISTGMRVAPRRRHAVTRTWVWPALQQVSLPAGGQAGGDGALLAAQQRPVALEQLPHIRRCARSAGPSTHVDWEFEAQSYCAQVI